MSTQAPARTAAEIAFQCRVNRIVDAWVSRRMREPMGWSWRMEHPGYWSDVMWEAVAGQTGRATDPPPDAAMRAAVIAEIDAIVNSLERRRSA
jgi:hypothetical protein